jgi:hypothetical protein
VDAEDGMTGLLDPQPMSLEQVRDLVERARRAMRRKPPDPDMRSAAMIAAAAEIRRNGWRSTSRVRCAARYAALVGCTPFEAGLVFATRGGCVYGAWHRIYPGVPTRPDLRT